MKTVLSSDLLAEIRHSGYRGEPSDLHDLLASEYRAFMERRSPRMPVEEFLLRPVLALEYADRVRHLLRTDRLNDHTILGLLRAGKNGKPKKE